MTHTPRQAAIPAAFALLALSTAARAQEFTSGVASGDVTQTTAIVWARGDAPGTLTFEVSPDRTFQTGVITLDATVVDVDLPVKRVLRDLTSGTRYYVRAVDAGGFRSAATFVTSDDPGVVDGFRFGVTGDSRGDNAPYHGVTNVPRRKLDVFIELGDTVYADVESPILPGVAQATTLAEFRTKHAEILQASGGLNALVDVRRSTPMLATIDDHEVTNDFAGGADPASDPRFQNVGAYINETPLFDNGLRTFEEWHPIGEERYGDTGDPLNAFKRKLYRRRWYGSDAAIHILGG